MKRREFIILSSVGAASASLLSACGHPEEKLIPAFIPDEEYVPGIDYWKASTCGMCPAGCGIIVRTREHKANKIEGNPLHPVNRGALCARGQAGLQVLYNPDRIKGPMKRVGERGEGKWEEIGWDEAIKTLADKLREIKVQGRADSVVFVTNDSKGVTGLVAELFMSAYGSKSLAGVDVFNENWFQEMYARSYGPSRRIPTFDIGNAQYLLSFGARFLETWRSPVMYSLAYGEFRRSSGKPRGRFAQIEPRMSLTGASADEWLPAAVGSETFVALGIAQVMVREGLVKDPLPPLLAAEMSLTDYSFPNSFSDSDKLRAILGSYAPEMTAEETGIPAERIIRIAREFASSQSSLAIGEGTFKLGSQGNIALGGGAKQVAAIHYLNRLVQNLNKPGGVYFPEGDTFDPLAASRSRERAIWLPMTGDVIAGRDVGALLIHSANPVHNAPRVADRIKTVPIVVSFSSVIDETAQLADFILPDHTYLECWDLKTTRPIKPGTATSLMQPIIKAELNTKQTADVLLAVGRELGLPVRFESSEQIVKQAASEFTTTTGSISAEGEDSGTRFAEQGVWIHESSIKAEATEQRSISNQTGSDVLPVLRRFESEHLSDEDYPLTLLTYEHATLGFGAQANVPALQELPDAMTSAMWGSWVEINPSAARELGISNGDLVEVRTTEGAVTVPAVLYAAIRPDVIALPYGQGHTMYGRYALNIGANAALLDPTVSNICGGLLTVRARVSKVGGKSNLIRFGTDLQERMEKKGWR